LAALLVLAAVAALVLLTCCALAVWRFHAPLAVRGPRRLVCVCNARAEDYTWVSVWVQTWVGQVRQRRAFRERLERQVQEGYADDDSDESLLLYDDPDHDNMPTALEERRRRNSSRGGGGGGGGDATRKAAADAVGPPGAVAAPVETS
jgi:hypothetical protein